MDSIKVLASKWAQRFKTLKVDLKEVQMSVSTLEFKEMKEVVPDMPDSSPFITDTHVPGTLGAEKPSDNLVWFAFSCYQLFTHHHKFFGALAAFNTWGGFYSVLKRKYPKIPHKILWEITRSLTSKRINAMNRIITIKKEEERQERAEREKQKESSGGSSSGSKVPRAQKQVRQHLSK